MIEHSAAVLMCVLLLLQTRLCNASGEPLKFADLHGKPLTFKTDKRPFRRCLVFQARYAMAQALAEGNITKPQLAEMAPYLASVSPQASNIAVRKPFGCVGVCGLLSYAQERAEAQRMCVHADADTGAALQLECSALQDREHHHAAALSYTSCFLC